MENIIIVVNFQTFQAMYMNQKVFVKETDDSWEMWTSENLFHIKCVVEKEADQEKNVMFVDRYFADRQNIVKAVDIFQEDKEKEDEEQVPMQSDEAIRDHNHSELLDDPKEEMEVADELGQ